MESTTEKFVSLLNGLIEINNDRIEGYERAAKETEDMDLKNLFLAMTTDSHQFKSELVREVTALGGKPSEGTTNSGKFYRVWMDVKAALTGRDRKAILNSCEFGEDAALDAYKDVFNADTPLPGNLRELVSNQKQKIQQSHDRIKALRDSVLA